MSAASTFNALVKEEAKKSDCPKGVLPSEYSGLFVGITEAEFKAKRKYPVKALEAFMEQQGIAPACKKVLMEIAQKIGAEYKRFPNGNGEVLSQEKIYNFQLEAERLGLTAGQAGSFIADVDFFNDTLRAIKQFHEGISGNRGR